MLSFKNHNGISYSEAAISVISKIEAEGTSSNKDMLVRKKNL